MDSGKVLFKILGTLEVVVHGAPVRVGGPRVQGVLAMLLVEKGRLVSIDELADAVWGEEAPSTVRSQAMIAVSSIRRAIRQAGLDVEIIETCGSGYRMRTDGVEVDAWQAEELFAAGRRAGEASEASKLLRHALALWRGPALTGMNEVSSLQLAARRWQELRLAAVQEWAELELALDRHRDLVGELSRYVEEDPLQERLRGQLMVALYRSGRRADALQVYAAGRAALVSEIGIEPGPELRRLHEAMLADDPALIPAAVGSAAEPEPEPGQRLDEADETTVPDASPAQLPPAVSAFVGRRRELGILDALLDRQEGDDSLPLCVVYGVAGVGKTGLAVSWARRVADRFPDGQLFAALRGHDGQAPPLRPEEVLSRFLRVLGVPGDHVPAGLDERSSLFRSMLEGRRVLIVLDDAASTGQVRPLLPGSASCCVLVTSRSPLGALVAREGAACVGLDVLSAQESQELLARMVGAERISREPPAAMKIAGLCDRLPLALRLAAAKLMSRKTWTVEEMASRLESERERLNELHQDELDVRGSFALSYRDLPEAAKILFRRLGLLDLPNGFATWTAAVVGELPMSMAEKLCERLVDAQLVQPLGRDAAGRQRYDLHGLIRLFARERAYVEEDSDSRRAVITRMMGCLLTLVELTRQREGRDSGEMVVRGGSPRWPLPHGLDPLGDDHMAWLEAERPTISAAVGQCAALGLSGPAWELTVLSVFLFERRGHYDDWRVTAEAALRTCRETGDRLGAAAMELTLGARHVHMRVGEAEPHIMAAIDQFAALGDDHGVGLALRYRATLLQNRGELDACRETLDRALRLLRGVGDGLGQAMALISLGQLAVQTNATDEAAERLLEAATLVPAADRSLRAGVLKRLADVYIVQGRFQEARSGCLEALDLVRAIDDRIGEAYVLHSLGRCLQQSGDSPVAETTLSRALTGARELRDPLLEGRVLLSMGHYDHAAAIFTDLQAHAWLAKAIARDPNGCY
ncbi:AfsR/SARP family transcriptional regulator [Nonomuraea sp. LPB2021202275-12-8]|uniref:AfsR/SARP family transcriptional regulator n=1 Tax=Nonomuraea sp. LPB2021202275-12-8 TaxID=3120159 RepID=UPI00300CDC94